MAKVRRIVCRCFYPETKVNQNQLIRRLNIMKLHAFSFSRVVQVTGSLSLNFVSMGCTLLTEPAGMCRELEFLLTCNLEMRPS